MSNERFCIRLALILCGTVAGFAGMPAANALDPSDEQGGNLDEIVVTAERREESIDKVPISMTALSQRTMDDLHVESVSDLATLVPGLVLTPPAGSLQDFGDIAIRGIFSNPGGGCVGNAPTTQLYIDETPISIRQMPAACSKSPTPNIFDLDRVEVLRGPQGTLFGASAMGGVVRFITPQPNLNDSSGSVKGDLSYTQGGQPNYEVGAAYGAPVVAGTAGFRVSAWFQSLGGFIDREDPFTGQILEKNANTSNAYVIRPSFTWAPSEDLTITPALFLQHQHDQSPNGYWINSLANPEGANHVWGGIAQPATDDLRVPSLAIKFNFAGLSFQSDTSYLDRNYSGIDDYTHQLEAGFSGGNGFLPGLDSFVSFDNNMTYTHAWQQELRLTSQDPSSRVTWVAGAFYRRAVTGLSQVEPPDLTPVTEAVYGETSLEATGYPDYIYDGRQLNFYDNFTTTDISEAVFGEVTVNVTQQLKADAGVRVDHTIVQDQHQFFAGPYTFGPPLSLISPDTVATPVTPKASLTYQFTDTDMVYASAAKGYRPGGASFVGNINNGNPLCQPSLHALGLTAAPATFSSDSLWSYELGTKDLLFDRRLSIEGSVFYIKWSNIQTTIALPSCATQFTGNQGEAISKGFDLQLAAIVTHNLKLGAAVGYTDAYYPNAAYDGTTPTGGHGPLLNGAGQKLYNVVPWTASTNAEYSQDVGSLWSGARAYMRIDYRWLDAAPSCNPLVADYDPVIKCSDGVAPNPAYSILNLRLGVTHGGWDLSAYVDNATHSDPRLGYSDNYPGTSQLLEASAIRPLTFGVTSWYRF
jgi:iron complex outermembrane recepter protein